MSFNDFPFLYEMIGGFLNISFSNGWFSIRCHLLIMMSFRLGTDGWYSVMNGSIVYKGRHYFVMFTSWEGTEVTWAIKNLFLIFNTSCTRIKSSKIERSNEFDCTIFLCEFDFVLLPNSIELNPWIEFDWNSIRLGSIHYAGALFTP